jgi:hypothetical protein
MRHIADDVLNVISGGAENNGRGPGCRCSARIKTQSKNDFSLKRTGSINVALSFLPSSGNGL